MDVTFSITGMPQTDAKLHQLVNRLQLKVLKRACVDAAQIVLDGALALVPVRRGALAGSLRIATFQPRSRNVVGAKVVAGGGAFRGKTFYGSFQEWGWRAGRQSGAVRNFARLLRKKGIKGQALQAIVGATDNRKLIPGKHYMARAAHENNAAVIAEFQRAIAQRIEEVAL